MSIYFGIFLPRDDFTGREPEPLLFKIPERKLRKVKNMISKTFENFERKGCSSSDELRRNYNIKLRKFITTEEPTHKLLISSADNGFWIFRVEISETWHGAEPGRYDVKDVLDWAMNLCH